MGCRSRNLRSVTADTSSPRERLRVRVTKSAATVPSHAFCELVGVGVCFNSGAELQLKIKPRYLMLSA